LKASGHSSDEWKRYLNVTPDMLLSIIVSFRQPFWLKIYPITLGGGKRLFADGTIPAAFKVTESTVTSKGVIIVNYERAGAVPTGSL
jgi:hypothetical protein